MNGSSIISSDRQDKIKELFDKMTDSPAKEADTIAIDWLQGHKSSFSGFINNEWLEPSDASVKFSFDDPFTKKKYADISLPSFDIISKKAQISSLNGFKEWQQFKCENKSQYLLRIAQNVEKNEHLFSVLESISSRKHLYRTKSKDTNILVQSLKYYARLTDVSSHYDPTGVICVIAGESNSPLVHISWRVASVLASGSSLLLLVDRKSCLSAFLFAELCQLSGLPPGVFNVLPVNLEDLNTLPQVSKVICTVPHSNVCHFIDLAAKLGMPCEVYCPKSANAIVFESADLHSAVDSILEAFCSLDTTRQHFRVLVQESISKNFDLLLKRKFSNISIGNIFSKTDMSCFVSESQKKLFVKAITEAKEQEFDVTQSVKDLNGEKYCHVKPTLISNVPTTSKLLTEISGPVMVTIPFRTVKESIAMFNWNKSGSDLSIWTEKLTLAIEVAHKVKTRTVWINSHGLFDASTVYGGMYQSGSSFEGGERALFRHLQFKTTLKSEVEKKPEPSIYTEAEIITDTLKGINVYRHFIGGSYKSIGNSIRKIQTAKSDIFASEGSSADIRSAVSAALVAQPKWEAIRKSKRCEILLKAADALSAKRSEICKDLHNLLAERVIEECEDELDRSVQLIRFWANQADKHSGIIKETSLYGKVFEEYCPVGIIGIQCEMNKPLLSFVALTIPAIAFGNAVIVVPSENCPVPALKCCEILHSSGVLGGTVNVVNGTSKGLTKDLGSCSDLDALWFSGDPEYECGLESKRLLICKNASENNLFQKFIFESTEAKTIYMPMGTIFAN